jgi:hypothetical protein
LGVRNRQRVQNDAVGWDRGTDKEGISAYFESEQFLNLSYIYECVNGRVPPLRKVNQ